MKKILFFFLTICFSLQSLSISQEDATLIADKIWKNECQGTLEGLTHWGEGEGFGSFGIGHFIWYSEGKQERFEETFPALIAFLEQKGVFLPSFLQKCKSCPWNSREEFYHKIHDSEMTELRKMLFETRGLQAMFIVDRFEKAIARLPAKEDILKKTASLTASPAGLYAVIDYLNFKGSGLSEKERYQEKGWGLLQVLSCMEGSSDPVEDFVLAAKKILKQRVDNAPLERKEEKWLKGWYNRLDTYKEKKS